MESPPPQFVINQVEDDWHPAWPPSWPPDLNGNLLDTPRSRVNSFTLRLDYDDNCAQCKKLVPPRRAVKCRHCRHKCQRQCSTRSASFKSKAGDEHWTKYLQATDDNSHLLLDGTGAIQHTCSCSRNGSSSSFPGKSPKDNIFSSLYSRFTDWIASKRQNGGSSSVGASRKKCGHRKDAAQRPNGFTQNLNDFIPRQNGLLLADSGYPSSVLHCHSPVSSQCSDRDSLHMVSSTCSPFTVISTPSISGQHTPSRQYYSSIPNSPNSVLLSPHRNAQQFAEQYPDFVLKLLEWQMNSHESISQAELEQTLQREPRYACPPDTPPTWTSDSSQRARKRRRSTHARKLERQKSAPLWKTWPSIEQICSNDAIPVDSYKDTFGDVGNSYNHMSDVRKLSEETRTDSQQSEEQRDPLKEFSIAYDTLQFTDCVRTGNTRNVCTGRWHGDVLIHCYHDVNEEERCNFWRTVSQLGKIRHENVVLYMGACFQEPNFAVVTSIRKGISLYEHIHLKGEKSDVVSSLHVARQIAQAMGYLHAKGVVVQSLCSRNVNLEPKVKLCLMDHSFPETRFNRRNQATVPRGSLSYAAPELLRRSVVEKHSLVTLTSHTEMSDVYAFGSLMYELWTGRFPMLKTPPDSLIYQVASGKRACLQHVTLKPLVKNLIRRCWSHEPMKRPEFEEITKQLQQHWTSSGRSVLT